MGGHLQLILAEHLDGVDSDHLQLLDVLLELPGCDAGVPRQPLLHLHAGWLLCDRDALIYTCTKCKVFVKKQ